MKREKKLMYINSGMSVADVINMLNGEAKREAIKYVEESGRTNVSMLVQNVVSDYFTVIFKQSYTVRDQAMQNRTLKNVYDLLEKQSDLIKPYYNTINSAKKAIKEYRKVLPGNKIVINKHCAPDGPIFDMGTE